MSCKHDTVFTIERYYSPCAFRRAVVRLRERCRAKLAGCEPVRTSLPDSLTLPIGAIFLRSFISLKSVAAFNLAEIFRSLGALGCYMNLVNATGFVVGFAYIARPSTPLLRWRYLEAGTKNSGLLVLPIPILKLFSCFRSYFLAY